MGGTQGVYAIRLQGTCLRAGRVFVALVLMTLLLLTGSPGAVAQDEGPYAGWKGCAGCHEALTKEWLQTRHAEAFKSLTKSGKGNLPGCVGCHVTGYEKAGGFIDEELTPELAGVQCEACHGPGKAHGTNSSKGSIHGKPGIDTCRPCHTPGQDPKFDYAKKSRGIHGDLGRDGKK